VLLSLAGLVACGQDSVAGQPQLALDDVGADSALDGVADTGPADSGTPDGGETMEEAELRKARADADMAAIRAAEAAGPQSGVLAARPLVEVAQALAGCAAAPSPLAGDPAARTLDALDAPAPFAPCPAVPAASPATRAAGERPSPSSDFIS
jgi:hypothetical protein